MDGSPSQGDRSRRIDLFENLDIVHIRLLVVVNHPVFEPSSNRTPPNPPVLAGL